MYVEKEKRRVDISCFDGSLVKGCTYINPGERFSDFINDTKETFIVVTDAEFVNLPEMHSFKAGVELSRKRETILLNKSAIKWIEEINQGEVKDGEVKSA